MAQLPAIGVRLHGGMQPKTCLELAEAADRLGFETVWFAENMFNRGVLPIMTACALSTKRIKVGIGVFNPYNRHPTLIAMEIGALDELCGGRVALGIGSGAGEAVERMGMSYAKPGSAMRDAVHIVRRMLRGETVDYSGNVFSVRNVRMEYAAPRPDLPIYVAAMGERSLKVVGEVADGLMISNLCPRAFTLRALEIVNRSAVDAGRKPLSAVMQYVPCVARPDRAAARLAIKPSIGSLLVAYWAIGESSPAFREAITVGNGIPEDEFLAVLAKLKAGEPAVDVLDDRFVDSYAIAGSAEDCIAAATRFAEAGVTELVLTFIGDQSVDDMVYLSEAVRSAR